MKTHVIKLNGKEYPLRFTWRAIAEFEKLSGLNAISGFEVEKLGVNEYLQLTHCGLSTSKDYELTIDELGDYAELEHFTVTLTAFVEHVAGEAKNAKKPGK